MNRLRGLAGMAAGLVAMMVSMATATTAIAHPLGNFTVNRHSEFVASGERLFLDYTLDLAEIPTVQIGDQVRAKEFGATLADQLNVRLDGAPARLRLLDQAAAAAPGEGSLATLRYQAIYEVVGSGTRLDFEDTAFSERLGWREVIARSDDGAEFASSSVPATSRSDRLTNYPTGQLESPLVVTSATARLERGSGAGTAPMLRVGQASDTPQREDGGFEGLIGGENLGLGAALLALFAAAFWGAAHALTPGHGKAIVAGYLIGARGQARDAVMVGIIVTVTHTAGVFALGAVTLVLSQFFVPEQLYPWLSLISALTIVVIGVAILVRWRRTGEIALGHSHVDGDAAGEAPGPTTSTGGHAHAHAHAHSHGATAVADEADPLSRRSLLGMGVAAGLLPCPTALIVLLSAIALDRLVFGFALILAFSVGLAATITGIGLVAVYAQSAFSRTSFDGRVVRAMPAVSAGLVTIVGLVLTWRAVATLGLPWGAA